MKFTKLPASTPVHGEQAIPILRAFMAVRREPPSCNPPGLSGFPAGGRHPHMRHGCGHIRTRRGSNRIFRACPLQHQCLTGHQRHIRVLWGIYAPYRPVKKGCFAFVPDPEAGPGHSLISLFSGFQEQSTALPFRATWGGAPLVHHI
jgi:hypothetical protein